MPLKVGKWCLVFVTLINISGTEITEKSMGKASYICAVCSQDFTRKWSGKRHNQDLHFGTAEIVRVLDYIIGRLSGKYFQANPLERRKRLKNRENKNHFRLNYRCAWTEESREGKQGGDKQRRRDLIPGRSSSRFTRDFSGHEENWDSLSESTQYDRGSKGSDATRKEKLDEIKALLSIRCPSTSERDIEHILNAASLQNDFWLNDYLKWLRASSLT
jgi:hypothetical protein